ncbi:MAG: discoidin domain-containing protein [Clostridia bacterium]|nr:discoidin domain-containing protein [Clostridia bacterium]
MKRFALLIAFMVTFGAFFAGCNSGPASDATPTGGGNVPGPEATPTPAGETLPEASGKIAEPAAEKSPITRDNITINAYLVQLQNEELRKRQMAYMREAEIDVVSHVYVDDVWVAEGHTLDKYLPIMKDAAKFGLKVYSRDYRVQTGASRTDSELAQVAKDYAGVDGFAGFYVVDEPYDPNPYARVENVLRGAFPDCYININFLPRGAYPEGTYYKRLSDFGSLVNGWGTLSLDTYCFDKSGGVDEYQLFKNYDDLRRAALDTGMNTAVYVQSVGYVNYRRPSAGDLRYNMMAALAYGVKELKFFTWEKPWGVDSGYTDAIFDADHNPTDLYDAVCLINHKIHTIGGYLAAGDAVAVYHTKKKTAGAYELIPEDFAVQAEGRTDAIVSVIERRDGGGRYLMIVNKNFKKAQTLTFSVGNLELFLVDDENGGLKAAPVENGVLTLTLEAGDCALLEVKSGELNLPKNSGNNNPYETDIKASDDPALTFDLAVAARLTATSAAGDGTAFLCNVHDGVFDDGAKASLISEDGSPQCLTFDLGAETVVNRVDLYPAGKGAACFKFFPKSFSILVSADGFTWYTAAEVKDFEPDLTKVPVFRFGPVNARYVRVAVTGFREKEGHGCAELGEVAIYNDGGNIPDTIPTLYKGPEDNEGDSVEEGSRALAVNKKVYEKGEPILVTARGEKGDYLVFYPEAYVPGKDAGVFYACFDLTAGSRDGWFLLENGGTSAVADWFCATPQNPQVVPYRNIPEGDYKVVIRDSGGAVKLEVFFSVE